MKKIKKFMLLLDSKKSPSFIESDISEEEKKFIENGFKIKEDNMKNKDNVFYILLLKTINPMRNGSTNEYKRTIYFYEEDKEQAKRCLIVRFNNILKGRTEESLQNLSYLTKKNIDFVNNLQISNSFKITWDKNKKGEISIKDSNEIKQKKKEVKENAEEGNI